MTEPDSKSEFLKIFAQNAIGVFGRMVAIAALPFVPVLMTSYVLLPVFTGAYLENGLLPWEMFLASRSVDILWWQLTAVWVFIALPLQYVFLVTWIEVNDD